MLLSKAIYKSTFFTRKIPQHINVDEVRQKK